MRILLFAALLLAAAVALDAPALGWTAVVIALFGLAASAAIGLLVLLVLAAIATAATRQEPRR
jgi:hypothetical protein